jgi:hypothetical protein
MAAMRRGGQALSRGEDDPPPSRHIALSCRRGQSANSKGQRGCPLGVLARPGKGLPFPGLFP